LFPISDEVKDIETRQDVEKLIDHFYVKVLSDEQIGPIFKESIEFVWEKHIPIMYDFWASILFDTSDYKGNPISKHIELDRKVKLTVAHFDRWLQLWEASLNDHFRGELASKAYHKAVLMKEIMLFKIAKSKNNNFIQ